MCNGILPSAGRLRRAIVLYLPAILLPLSLGSGRSHDRRGLSLFEHPAHQFGSTMRRPACILVDVHSVLLGKGCVHTISFLGLDRVDNLLGDHI